MRKRFTILATMMLAGALSISAADVNVTTGTELKSAIEGASSGDVIILADGDYSLSVDMKVKVPLTVKAANPLKANVAGGTFALDGAINGDVTIKDINFDGTRDATKDPIVFAAYFCDFISSFASVGNVLIENCTMKAYGNCLLRANRVEGTCTSFKVNNCIIYNIGSVAAYPFFQFTKTKIGRLELTNSTIYDLKNEFFQMYGTADGNDDGVVLFQNNTFYDIVKDEARTPFGGKSGKFYMKNCIIVKSPVHGTKEFNFDAKVTVREGVDNVIYDFANGALITAPWSSITGTLEIDPGFKNAAEGDFTIQAGSELVTKQIGDPRWINKVGNDTNTTVADKSILSVDYYDMLGKSVSKGAKGLLIEKTTYQDGSISTQKILK